MKKMKKAHMLARQKIIDRIAELNAEQGWVCDFSDDLQSKFYVGINHSVKNMSLGSSGKWQHLEVEFYGSQKTINTVLNELQEEYKTIWGIK